jgi:Fic family protein
MAKVSIEERWAKIEARVERADAAFKTQFREHLDMSWVFHDSALEGTVYTFQELKTAIDPNITVVPDSSLQPICEEIRKHREAIHWVRDFASKKRQPINLDALKKIYLTLHPSEGDLKTVKFRTDVPQHRLYFHEYAAPDKIPLKVKAVFDWLADPETRKSRSAVRVASRAHYDLLRTFPFEKDSGKVARLFMNLLLMRAGYPPAIVHHAERQRYFDSLKGSPVAMNSIVQEAIDNALSSSEKMVDEHETRTRAFIS